MIGTPFQEIYDSFLGKITDDMYLELRPDETAQDMESLLISAIPNFEFPRFSLFDYSQDTQTYNIELSLEEVGILSHLMVIEWIRRQLASVENTRMKYSGSDFKFTSQANHLHKLLKLKESFEQESKHLQRLYKRRKINSDGTVSSNFGSIMERGVL